MRKYLEKDNVTFLAHIVDKGANVKSIQNNPMERNHTEVFLEDLSGLPPTRIIKFRIDLVPGAAPIAKAPYCLTSLEMQELSSNLQELLSKGLIRSSSSPWGALVISSKRRADQYIDLRLSRVGPVAYRLELPQELSRIHDVFHVPNLKKGLTDETLIVPLKELHITDKLHNRGTVINYETSESIPTFYHDGYKKLRSWIDSLLELYKTVASALGEAHPNRVLNLSLLRNGGDNGKMQRRCASCGQQACRLQSKDGDRKGFSENYIWRGGSYISHLQYGCDQEFMSKRKVVLTIAYHDSLKKLKNATNYQRVHTAHCCAELERLIKAKFQRICSATRVH
ncbi:hypothetical protein Tco_1143318 [Tanacetum coccineum]